MLQEWKGQHVFLQAAKHVLEQVPNSVAVVVGDAPDGSTAYPSRLRTLASDLGIADRVVFAGYRQDVPQVMANLDVVVHASVKPEPFGTVVAEAMAMQRGVVAAKAGGPAEYVEHGINGFLTAPFDAREMAHAITTLLLDHALRTRMGEQARKTVVERFSAQVLAHKTQDLLDDLLDGRDRDQRDREPPESQPLARCSAGSLP